MYPAARIVSFLLSFIACLLLVAAVLVWFVVSRPMHIPVWTAGSRTPEEMKADKEAQDGAELQANLVCACISTGCVIVALVLLLFCDLVRAMVNTARDTHAMLEIATRSQQAVVVAPRAAPPR